MALPVISSSAYRRLARAPLTDIDPDLPLRPSMLLMSLAIGLNYDFAIRRASAAHGALMIDGLFLAICEGLLVLLLAIRFARPPG